MTIGTQRVPSSLTGTFHGGRVFGMKCRSGFGSLPGKNLTLPFLQAMKLSHEDTEPFPSLMGDLGDHSALLNQSCPQSYGAPASVPMTMMEMKQPTPLCCAQDWRAAYTENICTQTTCAHREEASLKTPFVWLPFPKSLCWKDHSALLGLLGPNKRGISDREVFIVHSKSKVAHVRKHLLYMIRNPVIQRGPYQKQYSTTEIHRNSTKPDQIWDYTEFWFCTPKEEKSHAKRLRGEGQSGISWVGTGQLNRQRCCCCRAPASEWLALLRMGPGSSLHSYPHFSAQQGARPTLCSKRRELLKTLATSHLTCTTQPANDNVDTF